MRFGIERRHVGVKVPLYRRREKKKLAIGLTSKPLNPRPPGILFQRICAIVVALKNRLFFVAQTAAIFAKSPEMRFGRAAGPTSGWPAPFKIF
jgi:hypothetical protein